MVLDRLSQLLGGKEADLWQSYLDSEKQGIRQEMLAALNDFIAAIEAAPEDRCSQFCEAYCRALVDEGAVLRLREPLFKRVIGPYLIVSHRQGVPAAPWWMSHMLGHFINLPILSGMEGYPRWSELELLREALTRDPSNAKIRQRVICKLADEFEYALHEVPAGVLYGHDGASVEECAEWLSDLEEFRRLAKEQGVLGEYAEDLAEWEFHFRGYPDYLMNRTQYRNYEHYIESHMPVA